MFYSCHEAYLPIHCHFYLMLHYTYYNITTIQQRGNHYHYGYEFYYYLLYLYDYHYYYNMVSINMIDFRLIMSCCGLVILIYMFYTHGDFS